MSSGPCAVGGVPLAGGVPLVGAPEVGGAPDVGGAPEVGGVPLAGGAPVAGVPDAGGVPAPPAGGVPLGAPVTGCIPVCPGDPTDDGRLGEAPSSPHAKQPSTAMSRLVLRIWSLAAFVRAQLVARPRLPDHCFLSSRVFSSDAKKVSAPGFFRRKCVQARAPGAECRSGRDACPGRPPPRSHAARGSQRACSSAQRAAVSLPRPRTLGDRGAAPSACAQRARAPVRSDRRNPDGRRGTRVPAGSARKRARQSELDHTDSL
jgi:hypothetical protein